MEFILYYRLSFGCERHQTQMSFALRWSSNSQIQIFTKNCIQNIMNGIVKTTDNTVYRKTQHYELWGHQTKNALTLQLSLYDNNGGRRIFQNSLSELSQGNLKINSKEVFAALTCVPELSLKSDKSKTHLKLENIPKMEGTRNNGTLELTLLGKENGIPLDNFMMMAVLDDKLKEVSAHGKKIESPMGTMDWDEPDPISHQSQKYCFKASYSPKEMVIRTNLLLEDPKSKVKKQYENNINAEYFSKQMKGTFKNLQNLFEHLRNSENYEVLYEKGRIRIVNQPQDEEELAWISKRVEQRKIMKKEKDKESLSTKFSKQMQEEMGGMKNQLDKKFVSQQTKIMQRLRHEMSMIEDDISNKMLEISKGLELSKKTREKQKKIDIEILEEWKEAIGKDMIAKMAQQDKKVKSQLMSIISEAKRQLAIIIHRLRNDFQNMIRENEDKCMASIDDLETDLCQKMQCITKGQVDPSTKDNQSTTLDDMESSLSTRFFRDIDWNPIEVDPNSSEFRKFVIDLDNRIQYNSGWEWTQLFTKTIIPHGSVISLEFKILKSAYNAIALGISDRSNISQKTSLSLKNSIAYWGDRQVWEGKKVKEEGLGFKVGDIVCMKVDTVKGIISWSVKNEVRAQHSSAILRDKSLHLMAYIQMYDKGDQIELLSFKLNDKQIE